ncbi:MAG: N-acetyltransferase [Hyphomicrobiaceae bacterium]
MLAEPLPTVTTRAVTPHDMSEVSALGVRVFGPGRFARTAYRVREGTPDVSPYCRLAECEGKIIASLRMTEIEIGGRSGGLLLGPLAVDPAHENKGYGRRLIAESLEIARRGGLRLVLLVGDLAYYGRLGFVVVPPGQIQLPGPADPARVLALELAAGALTVTGGPVTARWHRPAVGRT